MNVCHICGIPWDAGVFDQSSIQTAPERGQEVILARFDLHPNYCGTLLYFAQFTDLYARDPSQVRTPGYQWQIRNGGSPLDPYLAFDHIINPWGMAGFPVQMRLSEGAHLELVVRNVGVTGEDRLRFVGGRLVGRYWYNTDFGGAPNKL
jgi:hypothetical protein